MTPDDIGVVIPALEEAAEIGGAILSARQAGASEVIVSDGGSGDATAVRATEAGATKVVRSLPGRGIQLNSGVLLSRKPFVLFLHADGRLGSGCLRQIAEADGVGWGAFRQRIDSDRSVYRLLERGNALRVQARRMPFGDQAIFVRRSLLDEVGGVPEVPLMEDVELSRRLRRHARSLLLEGPVITSCRRWQTKGVARQTLLNWALQAAHACGASPETLARWYGR